MHVEDIKESGVPVLRFDKGVLYGYPKKLLEQEGYLKAEEISNAPVEEFFVNIGIIEQKQQLKGGLRCKPF